MVFIYRGSPVESQEPDEQDGASQGREGFRVAQMNTGVAAWPHHDAAYEAAGSTQEVYDSATSKVFEPETFEPTLDIAGPAPILDQGVNPT